MEKKTDELIAILEQEKSIERYFADNAEELIASSLAELLCTLCDKQKIERSVAIRRANMDKTYGYQLFSGIKKKPTRDKLLLLSFGMSLDLQTAQALLRYAGYAPLYPRNKRDSIILFCLQRSLSLLETNEMLEQLEEEILE